MRVIARKERKREREKERKKERKKEKRKREKRRERSCALSELLCISHGTRWIGLIYCPAELEKEKK